MIIYVAISSLNIGTRAHDGRGYGRGRDWLGWGRHLSEWVVNWRGGRNPGPRACCAKSRRRRGRSTVDAKAAAVVIGATLGEIYTRIPAQAHGGPVARIDLNALCGPAQNTDQRRARFTQRTGQRRVQHDNGNRGLS